MRVLRLIATMALVLVAGSPAFGLDLTDEWPGEYHGFNDGRAATLTVMTASENENSVIFDIRLEDHEREVVFTGQEKVRRNRNSHQMDKFILSSPDGLEKNIRRLWLHTWNTDYVSGYSKWSGADYGLAFARDGFEAAFGEGVLFAGAGVESICYWTGVYDGRNDGRRARLTVTTDEWESDYTFLGRRTIEYRFLLEDLDRGVTFVGSQSFERGAPHVIENLRLRSADGLEKNVERLFLHTWNSNYISGYTNWEGTHYGVMFRRAATAILAGCEKADLEDEVFAEVQPVELTHAELELHHLEEFVDPVSVAGPPSAEGSDPALVRVIRTDTSGTRLRLEEWNYLDGRHTTERVPVLTVEAGNYEVADGREVRAGMVRDVDHKWQKVVFAEHFESSPVILAQVASEEGSDAVTARLRKIDARGFEVRLQEEEAEGTHERPEDVAIIALQKGGATIEGQEVYFAGSTRENVTDDWYRIPSDGRKLLVAQIQTFNGRDSADLRQDVRFDQVGVVIEEEQSLDDETAHNRKESVGYLLARAGVLRRAPATREMPEDPDGVEPENTAWWRLDALCRNTITGFTQVVTFEACVDETPARDVFLASAVWHLEINLGRQVDCTFAGNAERIRSGPCMPTTHNIMITDWRSP